MCALQVSSVGGPEVIALHPAPIAALKARTECVIVDEGKAAHAPSTLSPALANEGDRAWLTEIFGVATLVPRSDDPVAAIRALHPHGVDVILDAAMLGETIIGAAADGGRFSTPRQDALPATTRGIEPRAVSVLDSPPRHRTSRGTFVRHSVSWCRFGTGTG